jgi:methionyl-tRNA synthetase
MRKNKFFVTTPIYYVNDQPHIGHLCTTLAADILARYKRLIGDNVFFLTGTDEHGAKIAEAAKKKKEKPKEYCDRLAQEFEKNWKKLNLSYDFFIRTTDPRHEKIVTDFIQKIYKNGDIYPAKYEGLYCVGCEKFLTDSDLVNGKCLYHPNRKPVKQLEDNYFFRLSRYEKDLKDAFLNKQSRNYYEIYPEKKKMEILSKLELGLKDVSISRANVSWGIPIPWDKKQTIYVWFEALLNYYTVIQFLPGKRKFWPPDLHIVGKEISWFHSVIWLAMLMSAKVTLPKKLFVHSFYISDGQKMSKSIGNVINPQQLIKNFGLEGARYLIASTFPTLDDSDITMEFLKERYNADLANGLGNLVQRLAKLCEKSKTISFKKNDFYKNHQGKTSKFLSQYKFNQALAYIWNHVSRLDKQIDTQKPWQKTGKSLDQILTNLIPELLQIAGALKPFLPQTAEKIEKIFTTERIKAPLKPLFPRIN